MKKRYIAAALAGFLGLGQPVAAAGKYTLITLLHTNDLHADVPEGLCRLASLVKSIRKDMPNVILLDAGDIFHGSAVEYHTGGGGAAAVMTVMGYDGAAVGNHELDFGKDTFARFTERVPFPFICANLKSRDGSVKLIPYIITEADDVKIAVLGLTTEETMELQWRTTREDFIFEDPIETAKKYLPELREKADAVVVLSHMGRDKDKELAKTLTGIDIIIGGHNHEHTARNRYYVGDTLIAQASSHGKSLGRIDFTVRKDENGAKIVSLNGKNGYWSDMENPPLGLEYPKSALVYPEGEADPEALAAYEPYRAETAEFLGEKIGRLDKSVSHRTTRKMCAAALAAHTGADIGVIDDRTVTDGLRSEDITRGDIFGLIRGYTRQELITIRVKAEKASALRKILGVTTTDFDYKRPPADTVTVTGQAYVISKLINLVPDAEIVRENDVTTREAIVEYFAAFGAGKE